MRVLPVIDLQGGLAVHGRAGQRAAYRPVQSVLASSADPVALATGIVHHLGLREIYLADLDAIGGQTPCWSVYRRLLDRGLRVCLDAGVTGPEQVAQLRERLEDAIDLVLGLESLTDLRAVTAALDSAGADRTVVSLDLDEGRPRTRIAAWHEADPLAIADELLALGVRRMILLDIRRVGMGQGTGTEELLRVLRQRDPHLELTCGGGIQDLQDVQRLARDGCDAVLVASALHRGALGREHIQHIARLGRRSG
jgi:phosphoribosylformimino-5-aminoimidazole carboxamide ribotide isomerase